MTQHNGRRNPTTSDAEDLLRIRRRDVRALDTTPYARRGGPYRPDGTAVRHATHRPVDTARPVRRVPAGGLAAAAATVLALAAGGAYTVAGGTAAAPGAGTDTVRLAADTTLFSDGFEAGANGWSKSGGTWRTASVAGQTGGSALQQSNATSTLARVWTGSTSWADYTVSARVGVAALSGSGSFAGVVARARDNSNLVRIVLGTSTASLELVDDGVVVAAKSVAHRGAGTWSTVTLTVTGGTATAKVGATTIGSVSGLPAAGRVGLVTATGTASFDDVTVVTAAGGGAVTPTPTPTPTRTATATPTPTPTRTTATPTPTPTRTTTTPAPAGAFPAWPTARGTVAWSGSTTTVTGTFDGGMKQYNGPGDGGQSESQPAIFTLADGAVLKNVVIGIPGADGVHCKGTCTLQNVWWTDVGEDAATFEASAGADDVMTIDGGGARKASDKVFQHNGDGTMVIRNFQVSEAGKLARTCGNCSQSHQRDVVVDNVLVTAPLQTIVGVNQNFGDTVKLTRVTIVGDPNRKISICDRFNGAKKGSEPTKIGSGPSGTTCMYSASDITYR